MLILESVNALSPKILDAISVRGVTFTTLRSDEVDEIADNFKPSTVIFD